MFHYSTRFPSFARFLKSYYSSCFEFLPFLPSFLPSFLPFFHLSSCTLWTIVENCVLLAFPYFWFIQPERASYFRFRELNDFFFFRSLIIFQSRCKRYPFNFNQISPFPCLHVRPLLRITFRQVRFSKSYLVFVYSRWRSRPLFLLHFSGEMQSLIFTIFCLYWVLVRFINPLNYNVELHAPLELWKIVVLRNVNLNFQF